MVVVSFLPHAEFGRNGHREDAAHLTYQSATKATELSLFRIRIYPNLISERDLGLLYLERDHELAWMILPFGSDPQTHLSHPHSIWISRNTVIFTYADMP